MQGLRAVLAAYFDVCVFRKRPQDMPVSTVLLYTTVIADAILNFTIAIVSPSALNAAMICIIHTAVPLLFLAGALQLIRQPNRTVKALIAQTGTSVVLKLIALPLVIALGLPGGNQNILLAVGWLVLFMWSISVQTFVFQHTLSIQRMGGFAVTVALLVLLVSLERLLGPAQAIPGN